MCSSFVLREFRAVGRAGFGHLMPHKSTKSSLLISHVLCMEAVLSPQAWRSCWMTGVCEREGEELNLGAGWKVMLWSHRKPENRGSLKDVCGEKGRWRRIISCASASEWPPILHFSHLSLQGH